jgi:hypothetical protein
LRRVVWLFLAVFLLGGCSGSGSSPKSQPTPCPSYEALSEPSKLPKDIDLSAYGTLISQEIKSGFLISEARSDLLVVEADPLIQRDLFAHDFEVLSHDNEGFEAEIFFARGKEIVGTFSLHNLCRGQIRIKLVLGADRYNRGDG